jgi:hypothetical protein
MLLSKGVTGRALMIRIASSRSECDTARSRPDAEIPKVTNRRSSIE